MPSRITVTNRARSAVSASLGRSPSDLARSNRWHKASCSLTLRAMSFLRIGSPSTPPAKAAWMVIHPIRERRSVRNSASRRRRRFGTDKANLWGRQVRGSEYFCPRLRAESLSSTPHQQSVGVGEGGRPNPSPRPRKRPKLHLFDGRRTCRRWFSKPKNRASPGLQHKHERHYQLTKRRV